MIMKIILTIFSILVLITQAHANCENGSWKVGDTCTFYVQNNGVSGSVDCSSAITYRVYEDETATPVASGTMALLDSSNTDGFYSESLLLDGAWAEKGKSYTIRGICPGTLMSATLAVQIEAEVDSNTVSDKTGYALTQSFPTNFASQSIDTSGRVLLQPSQPSVVIPTVTDVTNGVTLANDAITAAKIADDAGNEIADQVWDEELVAHTTADTPGKVVNMLTQDTVTLSSDVALTSIVGQLLDDGTTWSYSAATDSQEAIRDNLGGSAPTAAQIADAVWDEAKAGHVTTTTFGDLATDLDTVAVDVAGLDGAAMRGTDSAYTGTPPTAATIADSVWDEAATGHTDAGKAGAQIWTDIDDILTDTAVIGVAGAGLTNINLPDQTMNITGDITGNLSGSVGSVTGLTASNLDTTVSSRATPAQVNTEADTALADYDPPTRAEATADKDAILATTPTTGAKANIDAAYNGTGYCDGCIAVTVSSGAATPASPLVITETGIITVDNQFKRQTLRCGNQERKIAKTDTDITDSIVVEPGNPFTGALSGTCYIR